MSAATQMKSLVGQRLWWASPNMHFLHPGLYLCAFGRQTRVLPLPRRTAWAEFIDRGSVIGPGKFPEAAATYGGPGYIDLPSHKFPGDPQGRLVFRWKLGWYARLRVALTGTLWHEVLAFNQPLQPQLLRCDKPQMERGTQCTTHSG